MSTFWMPQIYSTLAPFPSLIPPKANKQRADSLSPHSCHLTYSSVPWEKLKSALPILICH